MEEPRVAAPGWKFCGVVSGLGSPSVDSVVRGCFRVQAAFNAAVR